jgi:predicted dehydrogenase
MAEKKLNMLLVGAGFMGKKHLESTVKSNFIKYTGIVDDRRENAEKLAKEFGVKVFPSVEKAVQAGKCAAADICTPTPFHLSLIKECAEYGLHILCEKPLTLNAEDAEKVKRVTTKNKVKIMVAQVLRFWPEYVYAVECVRKKEFGEVLSINCKRQSSPPGWNSWIMKENIGGGAVIDLQIHDFDFIYQLLGIPKSINTWGRLEQGTLNAIVNILDYGKNISVISEASYLMSASYPFRMFFCIELERAVIEMDFWRNKNERLKVFPADGKCFSPKLSSQDAYCSEIEYFAQKIIANKPFDLVPLEESITSLNMCLASKKSCELGRVEIEV